MSKASEKELSEIHAGLAGWCKLILQGVPLMNDGSAVLKPDGQPWLVPPSPAHMAAIRQFLKDNHIETDSNAGTGPLHGLAGLPVFEDDNVIPLRKQS